MTIFFLRWEELQVEHVHINLNNCFTFSPPLFKWCLFSKAPIHFLPLRALSFSWKSCFRANKGVYSLSQPHFEASVRMRLALPKVRTWSPPGLPQFQSSIIEVKTPCLEVFFILLERPWSVDVKNGLAWAIRTSIAQVMVERRAESQTGSLIPDHKKVNNRLDPSVWRWSAKHYWKALEESYKFALDLIPVRGLSWELWAPKVSGV